MEQIKKNKAELWADILELADAPLNHTRGKVLVEYLAVYDALCRVSHAEHGADEYADDEPAAEPHFSPQMAEEWTASMENADGTHGPYWPLERIKQEVEQRGIKCDLYKFWAVINSIHSDDVIVAKKHNVNTMDYYIDRAVAWLKDKDAVPNKAAAYYTHIVNH